jgi:hypothetical protein
LVASLIQFKCTKYFRDDLTLVLEDPLPFCTLHSYKLIICRFRWSFYLLFLLAFISDFIMYTCMATSFLVSCVSKISLIWSSR